MEDGRIPDSSLSSHAKINMSSPANARLNKIVNEFPYGWLASSFQVDWLQIDLGSLHQVKEKRNPSLLILLSKRNESQGIFLIKNYSSVGIMCI